MKFLEIHYYRLFLKKKNSTKILLLIDIKYTMYK